ncbi:MAG: 30S ribosomal protein S18 [Dehalococcoidia bacterium]|nr:30S ribosomal protein S18 [Dehalococcoidia bacterium]
MKRKKPTSKFGAKGNTDRKPRFIPRRRVCAFCTNKNEIISYKDAEKLLHFISDRGKIAPRRRTGTCAKHQRTLAEAIKRARFIALVPYSAGHISQTSGSGTF